MTVFPVRMEKSRPRKKQSRRLVFSSRLACHINKFNILSTERPALIQETKMANYVVILVLPVFSSKPSSSVSVPSIRESLRVSCSAKGSPLPTVTWYKNDVNMSVINKVTADEFTSELVIGEFQPADQATYRCVARNVYNDTVETNTRICKSTLLTLLLKITARARVFSPS